MVKLCNYIEILEDLLIAFRIPVFKKRAKRNIVSKSKFYLFNPGVYKVLKPTGFLDSESELNRCALEGLVAQHLRARNDYSNSDNKLYYWRTKRGIEVDFVLYGKSIFKAFEVKNSTKIRPVDLKSLRTFKSDYPEVETVLIDLLLNMVS